MTRESSIQKLITHAEPQVLRSEDLVRAGMTTRSLAEAVTAGRLIRLRRGWYATATYWKTAAAEGQHLAALIAAHRDTSSRRVFSHRTAATLLQLPVWSSWLEGGSAAVPRDPLVVHVTASSSASGASGSPLVRHRSELRSEEIGHIAEFTCTSPERTIFDLARTEPFTVAFACAESVLRGLAWKKRRLDTDEWAAWRERLLERAGRHPRGRGVAAARVIARLADPRSESVLESISRLRLMQLGIDVEQQVPVRAENGGTLHLDFRFAKLAMFGECDGKSKYTDQSLRGQRSAEEVLYAEKRRHDWVTATTGMRGIRWGAADVLTAARLGARLRAFGVPVPGVPSRTDGDEAAAFLRRLP